MRVNLIWYVKAFDEPFHMFDKVDRPDGYRHTVHAESLGSVLENTFSHVTVSVRSHIPVLARGELTSTIFALALAAY